MSDFTAQNLLRDILQTPNYTLARISEETGISRTTLSRISRNYYIVHLRNFNKLFRLYCRLNAKKRYEH